MMHINGEKSRQILILETLLQASVVGWSFHRLCITHTYTYTDTDTDTDTYIYTYRYISHTCECRSMIEEEEVQKTSDACMFLNVADKRIKLRG